MLGFYIWQKTDFQIYVLYISRYTKNAQYLLLIYILKYTYINIVSISFSYLYLINNFEAVFETIQIAKLNIFILSKILLFYFIFLITPLTKVKLNCISRFGPETKQ